MRIWTATYTFKWTPIIVFGTRRLKLLQWMQDNLEPVSFLDELEHVGFALSSKYFKILVERDGMTISNGVAYEMTVKDAQSAIDGVLESLSPTGLRLESAAHGISDRFPGDLDYEDATRKFGEQALGASNSEVTPVDAACLADFIVDDLEAQAEWGVVTQRELVERLNNPAIGRAGGQRPRANISSTLFESIAGVSLFVDSVVHAPNKVEVADSDGIIETVERVDRVSTLVARAVSQGMEEAS